MPRKKKIDTIIQNTDSQILNSNISDIANNETNISLQIENDNTDTSTIINNIKPKLKRGRKPKKDLLINTDNVNTSIIDDFNNQNNIILSSNTKGIDGLDGIDDNDEVNENAEGPVKSIAKKRGRKPKGGKIIQQISNVASVKETKSNIILHLKCHLKDLRNNVFSNNINGYDLMSNKNELYEVISNNENIFLNTKNNNQCDNSSENIFSNNYKNIQCEDDCSNNNNLNEEDSYKSNKNNDMKDLWKKLKHLQHNLHVNNVNDKKSACFWCTYEFDNPSIYIPKHYIKETYHVYGCFCSPECATAYLMEENIDSSTKFERYHLLNNIYSKIYDYKKNIKPAPKPYYILEKFYGNLNIQEYRSLLKNERLFLVVDNPLTRILPELHEDNDDFIINNKIISSNTYQIKRKLLQKHTKNNILSEKFGLQQN
jgi:hypothetical protein